MKAKLCDNCNSEIKIIRKGNRYVAECSYCGMTPDKGFVIEDFVPENLGDDYDEE